MGPQPVTSERALPSGQHGYVQGQPAHPVPGQPVYAAQQSVYPAQQPMSPTQQPMSAAQPQMYAGQPQMYAGQPQMYAGQPQMYAAHLSPQPTALNGGQVIGHPGMQQGMQVSALICPMTGQKHVEKSRPGPLGIVIGLLFFPVGFIAVIFDQKVTCKHCKYVIKEAWGGC
ncbi:hypothetical protein CcaverHIS002_0108570 [Cutaneotrichosporon cavernicola]|nr:hypothetical protein CcaverHIS002_0108570 [Cutaneotrichosporon cavernicola]